MPVMVMNKQLDHNFLQRHLTVLGMHAKLDTVAGVNNNQRAACQLILLAYSKEGSS